jgi:hypothetical protein
VKGVNGCPVCLKKEHYVVCSSCRQLATEEYAGYKAQCHKEGSRAKTEEEWIVRWGYEKISDNLPLLEQALKLAQENLEQIKTERSGMIEKAYKARIITLSTAGSIRCTVERIEGKNAWQELGGPAAVSKVEAAEARIKEAKRLLDDLAGKKAEFDSHPYVLTQVRNFLDSKLEPNEPEEKRLKNYRPKVKGGRAGEKCRLREAVLAGEL